MRHLTIDEIDARLLELARNNLQADVGLLGERNDLLDFERDAGSKFWTNLGATGSDADFIEVSLVGLKALLRMAFDLGRES